MSLGENLKRYRIEVGLSQKELAEQINVKQQAISLVELNKRTPSICSLKKIAKVFNCTIDELVN